MTSQLVKWAIGWWWLLRAHFSARPNFLIIVKCLWDSTLCKRTAEKRFKDFALRNKHFKAKRNMKAFHIRQKCKGKVSFFNILAIAEKYFCRILTCFRSSVQSFSFEKQGKMRPAAHPSILIAMSPQDATRIFMPTLDFETSCDCFACRTKKRHRESNLCQFQKSKGWTIPGIPEIQPTKGPKCRKAFSWILPFFGLIKSKISRKNWLNSRNFSEIPGILP